MKGRFYIEGTSGQPMREDLCKIKVYNLLLADPDVSGVMVRNAPDGKRVEVVIEAPNQAHLERLRVEVAALLAQSPILMNPQ